MSGQMLDLWILPKDSQEEIREETHRLYHQEETKKEEEEDHHQLHHQEEIQVDHYWTSAYYHSSYNSHRVSGTTNQSTTHQQNLMEQQASTSSRKKIVDSTSSHNPANTWTIMRVSSLCLSTWKEQPLPGEPSTSRIVMSTIASSSPPYQNSSENWIASSCHTAISKKPSNTSIISGRTDNH